jgi:translation initiation factor IF-2
MPRTPLHPEPRPVEEPDVIRSELAAAERAAASEAAAAERAAAERAAAAELAAALAAGPALDAPETAPDPAPRAPGPARSDRLSARPGTAWEGAAEPEEVDRFSLAREFSRLLQDDQAPADG